LRAFQITDTEIGWRFENFMKFDPKKKDGANRGFALSLKKVRRPG